MKCPVCGKPLIKVGYSKEFYQTYHCTNNCVFWKTKRWKFSNLFNLSLSLLIFIPIFLTSILILPFSKLKHLIIK